MKRSIILFLLSIILADPASAGFSVGMPDAVIKRTKKLENKIKKKRLGEGWVSVPGNLAFGTNDFFVMAYEAKNVNSVATSQANERPWVNIKHREAVAACAALGGGAHLVTIAEAQTINRNIEAQAANWADGVIGSLISGGGGLKRGNSGVVDSTSYAGGTADSGPGRDPKAKLVLSNGEDLWDWSGNVWERIYGAGANGLMGMPGGLSFPGSGGYEWNIVDPDLSQARAILGPSDASWTSGNGIGMYGFNLGPNADVFRGGSYLSSPYSGVFALYGWDYTIEGSVGFRCSK